MSSVEKVNAYLEEAAVFFLSTVDGDRPRCRPLGFHMLVDEQIYFCVGDFKDVYTQMMANPKVEIVACTGTEWMRLHGTAVFDSNPVLVEMAVQVLPGLANIYNELTGYAMKIFHLENATAEFRSMMQTGETVTFG